MNGRIVGGPHEGEHHDRFDFEPGAVLELFDHVSQTRICYQLRLGDDNSHYWAFNDYAQ